MNMMELPDESEINDNPFIMSKSTSVGQYSFVDYRQKYVKVAPPPVYFTNDQIIQQFGSLPTDKEIILDGLEYNNEKGGLICTDEEALDR